MDLQRAIRAALDRRTDISRARRQLDINQATVRNLRDSTLPALDLIGSYQLTGQGGPRLVPAGNSFEDIFGGAGGVLPGGYRDALSQMSGFDYRDWQVGLSFSYPIGPNEAHAQHAEAQTEVTRQREEIRQQEVQIAQEVRTAVRQVQTNRRRIDASRAARELQEVSLAAEQKKFEVGMTTSYFVVQAQRDLAQARANELQAIIDYNKAIVAVERAQGTLAERSRITVR